MTGELTGLKEEPLGGEGPGDWGGLRRGACRADGLGGLCERGENGGICGRDVGSEEGLLVF